MSTSLHMASWFVAAGMPFCRPGSHRCMSTCHLRTVLVRPFTTCMHAGLECIFLVIVPGSCESVLSQRLMRACVLLPVISIASMSLFEACRCHQSVGSAIRLWSEGSSNVDVVELQHHLHYLLPKHGAYNQKLSCYNATD